LQLRFNLYHGIKLRASCPFKTPFIQIGLFTPIGYQFESHYIETI